MKGGRDLVLTLLVSAILLLSVRYLTQCSAARQRPSPTSNVETEHAGEASANATPERKEDTDKAKLRRHLAEEHDEEERAKIQRVGHALQTIGANPELRKTLGVPP